MQDRSQTEILVASAQSGDRLALAKVLARCHPELRAWAEARMDAATKARSSPEDILQEVYLDVAQRIDRFDDRGPGSFLAWTRAILNQKLINARRVAHRQKRDINREVQAVVPTDAGSYWNLLDQVCTDSGTPSRILRHQEALTALLTSLSDLSETHRRVIQLRYLEGYSVVEVAEHLGKSEAAVIALTKRALEALRQAMDRLGEFTKGT